MNRNIPLYFINVGLVICFTLMFFTGIVKFPLFAGYLLFVYRAIPHYVLSNIHDWTGLTMVALVFAHLSFNRRWLIAMTKQIFKK